MNPSRRSLVAAIFSTATISTARADWPSKLITLVAPTQPGSDGDVIVRTLAQKMGENLGTTVVVDNKPGASGTLGVAVASRAAPDGSTAVITGTGPFLLSPLLNKQLPYDMEKSLEPVSLLSTFASVVVVSADSPYKTLADLIAVAKAQPGKLAFASSGQGTLVHLQGELLVIRAGVDMLHVPYKSQTPALLGVIAQETSLMIAPFGSVREMVRSGKLRALAITSAERMKNLPDVPTMAEAGVPKFVVTGWYGAYAPAGTPKALTQRLSAEMRRAILSPDAVKIFNTFGMDVVGSTPEELHATWKADIAVWAQVLKANPQIKLEE